MFLGVDIGTSAIKMVELRIVGEKVVISNYAWIDLEKWAANETLSQEEYNNFISCCLARLLKEANIKGRNAYIGLPSSSGLITIIEIPEMNRSDMEEAIKFEAQKYIPASLDNVVFSWIVLDDKNNNSVNNNAVAGSQESAKMNLEKIPILLVAASKSKVSFYEEIIRGIKLNLKSIEVESFPLVTSLIGNDVGNFLVVDIGSRICNIVLVKKSIIRLSRNIDAGGESFTQTIARNLGIDRDRAERLKVSGKNFFSGEYKLNFPALESITSEITRIIGIYHTREPDFKLDGIILSGGGSRLAGLADFLSGSLDKKVIIGNPFSRVSYNEKFAPLIAKLGPRFSVSLGLALGGAYNYLDKKKNGNSGFKIKIKELYLAGRELFKKDLGKKSA